MEVNFELLTPTTIMITGPTGSGKTELVSRMMTSDLFSQPISEIRYHYGAWQEKFKEMENVDSRYRFVEGVPGLEDLPTGEHHTMMVIDDLMEEVSRSKTTVDIFTKYSHHRNMSVVFLVQKLYGNSHNSRVISQNAHILILFKNPRDSSSVQILGRQMFPTAKNFLAEAFRDATQQPFSYLVVNSHQRTDERMRVIGNLFENSNVTVYIPKSVRDSK